MTNKKMTKREMFTEMLNKYNFTEDEKAFINHELELLAKKNSTDKKPTAQQIANAGIIEAIVEGMEPNRLYTITEIIKEIPACNELTNQRVSALVRQTYNCANPRIERIEDKRKAYFRKIAD